MWVTLALLLCLQSPVKPPLSLPDHLPEATLTPAEMKALQSGKASQLRPRLQTGEGPDGLRRVVLAPSLAPKVTFNLTQGSVVHVGKAVKVTVTFSARFGVRSASLMVSQMASIIWKRGGRRSLSVLFDPGIAGAQPITATVTDRLGTKTIATLTIDVQP